MGLIGPGKGEEEKEEGGDGELKSELTDEKNLLNVEFLTVDKAGKCYDVKLRPQIFLLDRIGY